jgi:predicted RNA-binding Zn ribbon-like protein
MVTTKMRFAGNNHTLARVRRQPVKFISVETSDTFRGQRIVGGNVALDLLNTQNGPAGGAPEDDVLSDYRDLLDWASHVGLLTAAEERSLHRLARERPADADTAFQRARETRAYLHDVFDAVAREKPPARTDLLRPQHDAAEALAHGQLVPTDGVYRWSWADDQDLGRPLWPIIHAGLTLVTDGPLDRVKGCASCRFVFVDESKNRSRRWCSMDDCGAQDKMRKYAARRASRRARHRDLVDR